MRKLRRPVGSNCARNSVCRTSICSQNFARVSARLFSILPAPERGSKMAAKNGVRKAKFCFRRHSFGSRFRPLLSIPTREPEMRKSLDKAREILEAGTQPSSQPGPAARSDKSSFRTFSSRFEMQLSIKLKTHAPYWHTLSGPTPAKPFLLGKKGTDFGTWKAGSCTCQRIKDSSPGFALNMRGCACCAERAAGSVPLPGGSKLCFRLVNVFAR